MEKSQLTVRGSSFSTASTPGQGQWRLYEERVEDRHGCLETGGQGVDLPAKAFQSFHVQSTRISIKEEEKILLAILARSHLLSVFVMLGDTRLQLLSTLTYNLT